MKAEEARKLADKACYESMSNEMNAVIAEIQAKASAGECSAYFYKSLKDATVKELKNLGYNYKSSFDRNEILVTISW